MDLKKYYFQNVKKTDYHYRFFGAIKEAKKFDSLKRKNGTGACYFEIYDAEEAIEKFKGLCQPEKKFDEEDICWFYLITFYLHCLGYKIKEFPRVLARPPIDPFDFVYKEVVNFIIGQGDDEDGVVRYVTRRKYIDKIHFVQNHNYIGVDEAINQKFREISNRNASFENMSEDEKLEEITDLIENMLKRCGRFVALDYSKISKGFITDDVVKNYRGKMQCFRHSSPESIDERKTYSESQKNFFIDFGLIIVKTIYMLQSE